MKQRVVKSAARTLQVLEFFDEVRASASVMEVSRALSYPQSSTSGLLKSLVTLGYLSYDPYARLYTPTHRVTLLGSWIEAPVLRQIVQLMEDLGRQTGETIMLGEQDTITLFPITAMPTGEIKSLSCTKTFEISALPS